MKIIKATFVNGVLTPSEPMPKTAVRSEFNGTDFVVYESEDEVMMGGSEYKASVPQKLKYAWFFNFVSKVRGFFIRLSYRWRDRA